MSQLQQINTEFQIHTPVHPQVFFNQIATILARYPKTTYSIDGHIYYFTIKEPYILNVSITSHWYKNYYIYTFDTTLLYHLIYKSFYTRILQWIINQLYTRIQIFYYTPAFIHQADIVNKTENYIKWKNETEYISMWVKQKITSLIK
jgi:hypothetical protein